MMIKFKSDIRSLELTLILTKGNSRAVLTKLKLRKPNHCCTKLLSHFSFHFLSFLLLGKTNRHLLVTACAVCWKQPAVSLCTAMFVHLGHTVRLEACLCCALLTDGSHISTVLSFSQLSGSLWTELLLTCALEELYNFEFT